MEDIENTNEKDGIVSLLRDDICGKQRLRKELNDILEKKIGCHILKVIYHYLHFVFLFCLIVERGLDIYSEKS